MNPSHLLWIIPLCIWLGALGGLLIGGMLGACKN